MTKRIKHSTRIIAAAILALTGFLPLPVWHLRPSASAQAVNRPSDALPAQQSDQAVRQLKEQGAYDSLQEAVAAARYELRWDDAPAKGSLPPAYHAPNPAQHYDAYFTPNGLSLAPRKTAPNDAEAVATPDETAHPTTAPEWRATMRLIGYGYGKNLVSVGFPELAARGNRIEYRRAWPLLTEWYVNKAAGLEQGFTIDAPPGIRSEGEPLRLALEVTGDLSVELTAGGQAVALKRANGEPALNYGELHATDAQGQELPSQMKVSEGQVILEIGDEKAVYPVTIDPTFTLQAKLFSFGGATGDVFGRSVAISWNTAVVGAPYDDIGSNTDQGSADVFVRNGTSWTWQANLTASNGAACDWFGSSVAISGDTIVVGAPEYFCTPSRTGSAYVFVRSGTTWSQQGPRLPVSNGAAGDYFGDSVAISGDTVVVGAPYNSIGASQGPGSAYVFVRNGTSWTQQQELIASDGVAAYFFGSSVAISGYGIVVGALGVSAAYVFVRSGNAWSQQAKLTARDGAAYDGDYFGASVAINGTGSRIVVGAPRDDIVVNGVVQSNQGSAYVFVRSNVFWTQEAKLIASDGAANDNFGSSVAISGYAVVVGAPNDDIVVDGVAHNDQGSAYKFVYGNGTWNPPTKLVASDGAAGDWFGLSVAIDLAGTDTIVVGAPGDDIPWWLNLGVSPNQGSAYVFIQ